MIPLSYNLRSLFVRRTTSIATAAGIGLVVFVLAGAFMLATGIQRTLVSAGRADNALVVRDGADSEMASSLELSSLELIAGAPGVQRSAEGGALVSGEVVIVIAGQKLGGDGVANVLVRGVTEAALAVRPEVRVLEGRLPRPGTDEVMIGKGLRRNYRGMDLGQRFELGKNRDVQVVGVFESRGSSFESEVWADVDICRSAFGREGLVSSIIVRLEAAAALDAFKAAIEADKRQGLTAMSEVSYYEKQSSGISLFIKIMSGTMVLFLAVGAITGALITMLAAVSQRQREIGTLRALGFSRTAILTSLLLESTLLALGGGIFGVMGALGLSSVTFSMMNFANWQQVTFSFDPDPVVLGSALFFGAMMGVLGGLVPALRAARLSPIEAMRN